MLASDILVIGTRIWLEEKSSACTRVIERLYGASGELNERGQYIYYGRAGGCLVTGNEDGVKHCSARVLYALPHLGFTIPPQADAGWIGEVGPGPSYLDPGSGRPEDDFTNRNTTFMTWNPLHMACMRQGRGQGSGPREAAFHLRRRMPLRPSKSRVPLGSRTWRDGGALWSPAF